MDQPQESTEFVPEATHESIEITQEIVGAHAITIQPDAKKQYDETKVLSYNFCFSLSRSILLVGISIFTALQFFALLGLCMVYAYKHNQTKSTHLFVPLAVLGIYASFIAIKHSAKVYAVAVSMHFLFSSICFIFGYILVYCHVNGLNFGVFESITKLFDPEPKKETYQPYQAIAAICLFSFGLYYFLVALAYHFCNTRTSTKEQIDEDSIPLHNVDEKFPTSKNDDEADNTTCVMTVMSIVLAVVHFILFFTLVWDCGKRTKAINCPHVIYHLLVGILAFYSTYIAAMDSIPVYRNAAVVHTGLSMIIFGFCFISLFHSTVKFIGAFGCDQKTREGFEYFGYGIIAAIVGCLYAVVAYLYSAYDSKTGISAINILEILSNEEKFNDAPNEVQYEELDRDKLHVEKNTESHEFESAPHLIEEASTSQSHHETESSES